MTGNLVSLALAAEARGRAQTHLDRARTLADAARAELETAAAELVQDAADRLVQRARPGEQISLPTREASYALRTVANELRGLHDERTLGLTRRRVAHLENDEGVAAAVDRVAGSPRRGGRLERADVLTGLADQPVVKHGHGRYR